MTSNFGSFSTHKHVNVSDFQKPPPSVGRQPQTKVYTASQLNLFFTFGRPNVNCSLVQGFRDGSKRQCVRAKTILHQYY